jgi:hypothetical protein
MLTTSLVMSFPWRAFWETTSLSITSLSMILKISCSILKRLTDSKTACSKIEPGGLFLFN